MNENRHSVSDIYHMNLFRSVLKIAPFTALCAALVFTISRLMGAFPDTSLTALCFFDIATAIYMVITFIYSKRAKKESDLLSGHLTKNLKILLIILTTLQWNLISYIFPTRDFWGYAPMFVLLCAFFFDSRAVLADILCITVSIALSWVLNGDALLPPRDSRFAEDFLLRCIGLLISFLCVYTITLYGERFRKSVNANEKELREKTQRLSTLSDNIIDFTANMVEERDSGSGLHVKRVKAITESLAEQMMLKYPEYNLTEEDVTMIAKASVLHDVGKIRIPDSILLKPDFLTEEEFDVIRTHAKTGADIVEMLPQELDQKFLAYCREICLYHHERYDGKGYPQGLTGEDIPVAAQIVAVADCYDALTSERPYKNAIDPDTAVAMIQRGECGLFSGKLLSCLTEAYNRRFQLTKPKAI